MELPSLLELLLPKPPSVAFQNAFITTTVFHSFDSDHASITKFTVNAMQQWAPALQISQF